MRHNDKQVRKVYIAASITIRSPDFLESYRTIREHLEAKGSLILASHIAGENAYEVHKRPEVVYARDSQWLKECDCLVAEISIPSLGVGYEIASALYEEKPVLCLYKDGIRVSKLISGIDKKSFRIEKYRDIEDLKGKLDRFLEEFHIFS